MKLTLAEKLLAIDLKSKELYDELDDEQLKDLNQSLYILNRYISSSTSDFSVLATNEYYNKHFFTLSKHPKLLWLCLCMCGTGKKQYHQWIGYKKKNASNNYLNDLKKIYPNAKISELENLIKINTEQDLKELIKKYEHV